jgi:hypothetical protein
MYITGRAEGVEAFVCPRRISARGTTEVVCWIPNQIISLERWDSGELRPQKEWVPLQIGDGPSLLLHWLKRHQELIQLYILNTEWHIPRWILPLDATRSLRVYLGISVLNLLSDLLLQVIKKDALDFRIQPGHLGRFLGLVSCEGC